ncbi:Histidine kinase-like ATPase, ATP-binding domain [Pseudocohnilembus persalinus]|uniref:histidine kinase n=1 Tax=Pseudocohnilembus persalinus TaxID=266149 RepID=A0A0V0QXQ9_PSEPJ|nr:Histidine kinase-like ATPase, ATP-binding domain [Pseudocohnilembus persalinus]|eukprot:KRX06945.1 Histidine kinase-like ATPase, ATP-binding domain [Pseudocohnilembus persalinus]
MLTFQDYNNDSFNDINLRISSDMQELDNEYITNDKNGKQQQNFQGKNKIENIQKMPEDFSNLKLQVKLSNQSDNYPSFQKCSSHTLNQNSLQNQKSTYLNQNQDIIINKNDNIFSINNNSSKNQGNNNKLQVTVLNSPAIEQDFKGQIVNQQSPYILSPNPSYKQQQTARTAFTTGIRRNSKGTLRTPLNYVLILLQMWAEDPQLSDDEKMVHIFPIQCANQIIVSFLDDLNDIVSFEVDNFQLNLQEFNIIELIQNTIAIFTPQVIQNDQINLNFLVHNLSQSSEINQQQTEEQKFENFVLSSDPNRIRQIIINLLQNSFKFTAEGNIQIQLIKRVDYFEIIIQDTGVGIQASKLQEIQTQIQNDDTQFLDNKQQRSLGLGLKLCNKLVLELNKKKEGLQIESEENQGTIISFKVTEIFEDITEQESQKINNTQYQTAQSSKSSIFPNIKNLMAHILQKNDGFKSIIKSKMTQQDSDEISCYETNSVFIQKQNYPLFKKLSTVVKNLNGSQFLDSSEVIKNKKSNDKINETSQIK